MPWLEKNKERCRAGLVRDLGRLTWDFLYCCRISITFRKMDPSKVPKGFSIDTELQGLRPCVLPSTPSIWVTLAFKLWEIVKNINHILGLRDFILLHGFRGELAFYRTLSNSQPTLSVNKELILDRCASCKFLKHLGLFVFSDTFFGGHKGTGHRLSVEYFTEYEMNIKLSLVLANLLNKRSWEPCQKVLVFKCARVKDGYMVVAFRRLLLRERQ